jgi:hypothetical protein
MGAAFGAVGVLKRCGDCGKPDQPAVAKHDILSRQKTPVEE